MVILAGLLSRSRLAAHLPSFLSTYAGDTLWALALYVALCLVFPGMRTAVIAFWTIAIAFSVEFSQLYQADWINAIRGTRIGALFLGVGFQWSDLPCYAAGSLLGAAGDAVASAVRGHGNVDRGRTQNREAGLP